MLKSRNQTNVFVYLFFFNTTRESQKKMDGEPLTLRK